jgi:UDP-N-acetylglucosamine 1-carboxyvinyltransferase
MDKFIIRGGDPLLGTVRVSGAKNAALPCMAAALLTDEPVILENIPQVRDIQTTRNLLAAMGAEVELGYGRAQHRTTIQCATLSAPEASYAVRTRGRAGDVGGLGLNGRGHSRSHAKVSKRRRGCRQ